MNNESRVENQKSTVVYRSIVKDDTVPPRDILSARDWPSADYTTTAPC